MKSKHTSLKKYTNWAKLIYFSLVLRERKEKKPKFFAPKTALHMAVLSNNTDDISEELAYLLENGGDVLIPGKDF